MSASTDAGRRVGRLPTPHGEIKVFLECWSSDVSKGGLCGRARYIGSKAALLASGALTKSMLQRRAAWSKGHRLLDEHGTSFGIQRVAGFTVEEKLRVVIDDIRPELPGIRELFPDGLPAPASVYLGCRDFSRAVLPALQKALERRYPGVKVETCETRIYPHDGSEGFTITFMADSAEPLLGYGLARHGKKKLLEFYGFEVEGSGGIHSNGGAYIVWHCYDSNPRLHGNRPWPPKSVQNEFARIWRRMRRSAPAVIAVPNRDKA